MPDDIYVYILMSIDLCKFLSKSFLLCLSVSSFRSSVYISIDSTSNFKLLFLEAVH